MFRKEKKQEEIQKQLKFTRNHIFTKNHITTGESIGLSFGIIVGISIIAFLIYIYASNTLTDEQANKWSQGIGTGYYRGWPPKAPSNVPDVGMSGYSNYRTSRDSLPLRFSPASPEEKLSSFINVGGFNLGFGGRKRRN